MTIALGFLCQDGILLGADSEMSSSSAKIHGMKLGILQGAWGDLTACFSGNVDYAAAALENLGEDLEDFKGGRCLKAVRGSLEKFYRQHVMAHPSYPHNPDWLGYSFLIALRENGKGPKLYVTNETALRSVRTYRCEGVGRDVGNAALFAVYEGGMSEPHALAMAAYVLATVKHNVPACSGPSAFLFMPNEGEVRSYNHQHPIPRHMENVWGWFQQNGGRFLASHILGESKEFEARLLKLTSEARHLRALWDDLWNQFISAEQQDPESPKAEALPPQPSQE